MGGGEGKVYIFLTQRFAEGSAEVRREIRSEFSYFPMLVVHLTVGAPSLRPDQFEKIYNIMVYELE